MKPQFGEDWSKMNYITCIVCGGEMQVIDESNGHYGCDTCGRENLEGNEWLDMYKRIKKKKYKALSKRCRK